MPPVIAAIAEIAATTITIAGVQTTIGAVVSAVVTVASVGMSAYQAYQQQQAAKKAREDAQRALDQQGLQFATRGTVQPWQIAYGRVYKAGAVFFERVSPPFYYVGVVIASHEIDGIEALYINGEKVTVNAAGYVTSGSAWQAGSSVAWGSVGTNQYESDAPGESRAKISVRLGSADQAADPIILKDWPSMGSNFRQRGHATIVLKAHYGASIDEFQKIWNGAAPTPQALFRGKKVFDPTEPGQDPDVPSTWRWSESPTLCATDYLRSDMGGRLDDASYDWTRNGASALVDRSSVTKRDGTAEAQYTCAAVIDTSASAVDVLRQFLLANRGRLVSTPDGIAIIAGRWTEPVFTIHDGLLAGGIDYQADSRRREIVNKVRTRIIDPASSYQLVEGPTWTDEDALAEDGLPYETTLQLNFVSGGARAQRLAKAFYVDSRLGRSLRLPLDIEAMRLEPGDVVTVDLTVLPIVNGTYMVEHVRMIESFTGVEVEIVETSPSISYFDPSVDETTWPET